MFVIRTCNVCNGRGFITFQSGNYRLTERCKRCNRTGKVYAVANHKELLQRASTDELSMWLDTITLHGCPPDSSCMDERGYHCANCWNKWPVQGGKPGDTLINTLK